MSKSRCGAASSLRCLEPRSSSAYGSVIPWQTLLARRNGPAPYSRARAPRVRRLVAAPRGRAAPPTAARSGRSLHWQDFARPVAVRGDVHPPLILVG
eukprot:5516348-Prymnesium_polylepis.1